MSDHSARELVGKSKLEILAVSLNFLGWGSWFSSGFLGCFLVLLKSCSLICFCFHPFIVVKRQGHVQTVNAAILGGMLGAPDVLTAVVLNGGAFLGDLPFGATSFSLLLHSGRGTITLLAR